MSVYTRKTKFCYYKVFHQFRDSNGIWCGDEPYNLVNWMEKAERLKNTNISLSNCSVTFDRIAYSQLKKSEIYIARLLKIRDINVPSKVKEGEVSQPIPLAEDEYIGEDVFLLYDRTDNICMFQQNRHSLSIQKLVEWVNKENNEDERIFFSPIMNPFSTKSLEGKYVRSIDFTLANMDVDTNSHSLWEIIGGIRDFENYTAKITLSVGRSSKIGLNSRKSSHLIQDLISNPGAISTAHIKMQDICDDDEPSKIELVDLFENSYHDYIEFSIEYKKPLSFEEGQKQLLSHYLDRKNELKRHIRSKK